MLELVLNAVISAYREVPQSSVGFSLFYLLYGRYVRRPMAVLRELWTNEKLDQDKKTAYGHMVELRQRLEETCKLAHKELKPAKLVQKSHYDKKSHVRHLQVGDKVLLLPTDHNKWLLQWKGPFPVFERRNDLI